MAYGTSQIGINAMTMVQQQEVDKDTSRTDIVVNVVSIYTPVTYS